MIITLSSGILDGTISKCVKECISNLLQEAVLLTSTYFLLIKKSVKGSKELGGK